MDENIEKAIRAVMPNPQPASEPRELAPYLLSANELLKADISPKKFLISTFVPAAGLGMLYAPRGLGKSWFAMSFAASIAKGDPTFLGWQVHEQGDVLFVDGEMSLSDLRERLVLLLGNEGCPAFHVMPSENLYRDGCPICLDVPEEHQAIIQLLGFMKQNGTDPKLIILDNLSTLRRGINENDNSEAHMLLDFLIKLRHMGYCVLIVHHTNKKGEQRGASILEVPLDFTIKLEPPTKADTAFQKTASFVVELHKVRNKRPLNNEFKCELKENKAGTLELVPTSTCSEVPEDVLLLRFMKESNQLPTQRVCGDKLGWALGKVNRLIKRLTEEGAYDTKYKAITQLGEFRLHEYFPEQYAEPTGYKEYVESFPF